MVFITIVIVEDELATRQGLSRIIKKLDEKAYRVVGEADNGYEGMQLIRTCQPDVVITDIRMPRVNGLDMIENAQACSPDTRYILLSGHAEFDYAKQAVRLPVEAYLLKPITVAELSEALEGIRRTLEPPQAAGGEEEREEAGDYSPAIAYVIQGINSGFAQKLYLEDFAAKLKMTPEYLGALFSKATGRSFSAYLRDVRMEHAKRLLVETDAKIYEIAYKTGYADAKYFCRVFKEYTGYSARTYAREAAVEK